MYVQRFSTYRKIFIVNVNGFLSIWGIIMQVLGTTVPIIFGECKQEALCYHGAVGYNLSTFTLAHFAYLCVYILAIKVC